MVVLKNCLLLLRCSIVASAIVSSTNLCAADILLLDFGSAACAPCQEMRPVVQRLAAAGYRVRYVDIAREPALAAQFKVDQVPTFVALIDGRENARMMGTGTYEELQQMLAPRGEVRGQSPDPVQVPSVQHLAPMSGTAQPMTAYDGLDTPQAPPTSNPFSNAAVVQAAVAPSANHAQLLEATVKISVEDSSGNSAGTGTIVDARDGAALLLTCGHLFRESAGKGPITVTFYQSTPAGAQIRETAVGQLLNYDLERDLALVVVRPGSAVKAMPVAPANTPLAPGATVTTVGCNGGANPTVLESSITTIDRYQGPPNVEVAGAPVEGRSGGGLFNRAGQLIGVCFAADPQSNEGLYASLTSIQAKLDSLKLGIVYQSPSTTIQAAGIQAAAPIQASPVQTAQAIEDPMDRPAQFSSIPEPAMSVRGQDDVAERIPAEFAIMETGIGSQQPLSSSERAALEEIQQRGLKSEVICIIRPHDPSGKSEVITLNNVTPQFVDALSKPGSATANRSPATEAAGQLLR